MALSYGANLGLLVNGLQGEGHYTALMALWRGSDFFGMPRVQGYLTNTPPAGVDGNAYIIGAAPTGLWAGQAGKIARYNGTGAAWEFYTPKEGWQVQNGNTGVREIYRYTSGAWEIFYQEGTFTPSLTGATTAGAHTYAVRYGRYTKLGRIVNADIELVLSAKGGTMAGAVTVTGLPLTSAAQPGSRWAVQSAALALTNVVTGCVAHVSPGSTTLYIYSNTSQAAADSADVSSTTRIYTSGIYTI